MSVPAAPQVPTRALVEFEGSVGVERGRGPVGLLLRGGVAPAAKAEGVLELLFSAVTQVSPAPPPSLRAVRVVELESGIAREPRRFRIDAREGQYTVLAHGVQRHADASAAFFAVLPRTRVALMRRWGWTLLLSLMRVAWVARLVARRRA